MLMKEYLLDTFQFNDKVNKSLLVKIDLLSDKSECIKLFSHLINSQYKWMARIIQNPDAQEMSWWEPIYEFKELEEKWNDSLKRWTEYLSSETEEALFAEVTFKGFDGGRWAATPKDIALQLNYHSIHHRAQMQTIIRRLGLEPDFVDYIGTKYKKLS